MNQNITVPHKDLLLCYLKLVVSMLCIQEFMIERIYEGPTGKRTILPPIINPKFPSTRNCSVPSCESCMLDRFNKRSTGTTKVNPQP